MTCLRARWLRFVLLAILALALLAVVAVAAFPIGPFRRIAEERLSARFGQQVTIGALEREEIFSFNPTIVVRDVRVPQVDWAGGGDLARIAELRTRIRALPLLLGTFSPSTITVRGARLDLVRAADGRKNWQKADTQNTAGGDAPQLDNLAIEDAVVRYRDAKRDRAFTVRLTADPANGLRLAGTGTVRDAPVTVRASGPSIGRTGQPWPFEAVIDGAALALRAKGTMDTPLDTDHMTLSVTARADDLKLIDSIIEAGLFGTQPVRLSANVRHDDTAWKIANMKATIGGSDFTGRLDVTKADGRTMLDGVIHAGRLDFDDLADDAGLAKARATTAAIGPRVVPNTRVNIRKITKTDGKIAFRVDRIVSRGQPTSLSNLTGTLLLDRQLLTIDPLRVSLPRGTVTGRVVIDQRGGKAKPAVTLALDLTGGSIAALAGGPVSGRLDGRVRLTGTGSTLREVVAASDGGIGVVARDGALPAKLAAMLGFDAGRALTTDDDARATLRCAVARLVVQNGQGRFAPLIVDTSASQTRGTGGVAFPAETLRATLTGAPKRDALLRIPGSVYASGTLSDPQVTVPREVKSVGNILKGLGRAITGKQGPAATDANCAALSRQAIGR
ncbi:AsmA family protein [Sphingomonas sp. RS2018]